VWPLICPLFAYNYMSHEIVDNYFKKLREGMKAKGDHIEDIHNFYNILLWINILSFVFETKKGY